MTNIKAVEILKELVEGNKLLSAKDLEIDNVEELLNKMDDDNFCNKFSDVCEAIKKLRNDPPGQFRYRIPIKERKLIKSIEEEIYFRVYNSCEDDSLLIYYDDLSAYISDDFGIIAEALYWGYNDEWLNSMFNEYIEHRIPGGELKEMKGSLVDILMKYYMKCSK